MLIFTYNRLHVREVEVHCVDFLARAEWENRVTVGDRRLFSYVPACHVWWFLGSSERNFISTDLSAESLKR